MKNFLDLPRSEDFFKTTLLDLSQSDFRDCFKENDIRYKKGLINMRNIVDISEFNITIKVIDETKMEDFQLKMKEYSKSSASIPLPYPSGYASGYPIGGSTSPLTPDSTLETEMPVVPTKDITLKGTTVLYFNGMSRIIMADFKEFESIYFEYLQKEKLDL